MCLRLSWVGVGFQTRGGQRVPRIRLSFLRGGAVAACQVHTLEVGGSIPPPATSSGAVSEALPAGMGCLPFSLASERPLNLLSQRFGTADRRAVVFFRLAVRKDDYKKKGTPVFPKACPREAGVAAGKDPHLSSSGMVPESGPGGPRLGDGVDTSLVPQASAWSPFPTFRRVPGAQSAGPSRAARRLVSWKTGSFVRGALFCLWAVAGGVAPPAPVRAGRIWPCCRLSSLDRGRGPNHPPSSSTAGSVGHGRRLGFEKTKLGENHDNRK